MRFQSTQASCGPAALRNALLVRGVERSEEELAALCGYKPSNGTSAKGMMRALILVAKEHPGLMPAVLAESRGDVAILRLMAAHRAGIVGVLLVDNWEHWVVSFGTLGEATVHVSDSDDTELVKHYSLEQLERRWRGAGRKPYYGILI